MPTLACMGTRRSGIGVHERALVIQPFMVSFVSPPQSVGYHYQAKRANSDPQVDVVLVARP